VRITLGQLKYLIREATKKANAFKKIKGGKRKAIKNAKYGDPKKRKVLKEFLEDKFGKVKYCKTCAVYDITDAAKKAGVTEDVEKPSFAFCHAFGFSCKATNSCTGYTEGGPKK
jgi:hypothetical protein